MNSRKQFLASKYKEHALTVAKALSELDETLSRCEELDGTWGKFSDICYDLKDAVYATGVALAELTAEYMSLEKQIEEEANK